jgi:UDP-N-acetylmuramyl pentapeptide phosphotransferase/UDP-N-acetylglucosamine-1-phosphate transferase
MEYIIIAVILLVAELVYFRIADRFNIIDKPNARSSHTKVVLRGGGVIFTIALWIWSIWYGFPEPWLLVAVTLAAGVSFVDDIHSLPDSLRLVVQFAAMIMILYPVAMNTEFPLWVKLAILVGALIFSVGGTNIFNFMDGINGITAGYALAMVIPLYLLNLKYAFMDGSLLVVMGLSLLVFSLFNFRTKARCFAGDVGSIGMALFLVFCVSRLMYVTGDVTWIVLYLLYSVDGVLTVCHRIMLHENLGKAHRKHVYQLMANELKMPHVVVSTIYMVIQLVISLIAIYLIPDTTAAHWIYFGVMSLVLGLGYIAFKMKYYHLHEEYLEGLKVKG